MNQKDRIPDKGKAYLAIFQQTWTALGSHWGVEGGVGEGDLNVCIHWGGSGKIVGVCCLW